MPALNTRSARLTPADLVLILAVAAAALWSALLVWGNPSGTVQLAVEAGGSTWVYPLDTDRSITIPGPLGPTEIRIEGGAAHIINSPCPNKTCTAARPISRSGEWMACLPNQVIVRIVARARESDAPDAVAY